MMLGLIKILLLGILDVPEDDGVFNNNFAL